MFTSCAKDERSRPPWQKKATTNSLLQPGLYHKGYPGAGFEKHAEIHLSLPTVEANYILQYIPELIC